MNWAFLGGTAQGLCFLKELVRQIGNPEFITVSDARDTENYNNFLKYVNEKKIRKVQSYYEYLKKYTEELLVITCRFNLIPVSLLRERPNIRFVNLHNAFLPRWRGVHPVHWAIESGDKYVGLSLHVIDDGIDTGDIIWQKKIPITHTELVTDVLIKILDETISNTKKMINAIITGVALKQSVTGRETYARRRTLEDSQISGPITETQLINKIRAMQLPAPFCFVILQGNKVCFQGFNAVESQTSVQKDSLRTKNYILRVDRVEAHSMIQNWLDNNIRY